MFNSQNSASELIRSLDQEIASIQDQIQIITSAISGLGQSRVMTTHSLENAREELAMLRGIEPEESSDVLNALVKYNQLNTQLTNFTQQSAEQNTLLQTQRARLADFHARKENAVRQRNIFEEQEQRRLSVETARYEQQAASALAEHQGRQTRQAAAAEQERIRLEKLAREQEARRLELEKRIVFEKQQAAEAAEQKRQKQAAELQAFAEQQRRAAQAFVSSSPAVASLPPGRPKGKDRRRQREEPLSIPPTVSPPLPVPVAPPLAQPPLSCANKLAIAGLATVVVGTMVLDLYGLEENLGVLGVVDPLQNWLPAPGDVLIGLGNVAVSAVAGLALGVANFFPYPTPVVYEQPILPPYPKCNPNSTRVARFREDSENNGKQVLELLMVKQLDKRTVDKICNLITLGADLNFIVENKPANHKELRYPREGLSPLIIAVNYGHDVFIKHFLKLGAVPDYHSSSGTALSFAARMGRVMAVELLIEKGADMYLESQGYPPSYGKGFPMNHAVIEGSLPVVKKLMDLGYKQEALSSIVWQAASYGHVEIVDWAIKKGADLNIASQMLAYFKSTAIRLCPGMGRYDLHKLTLRDKPLPWLWA